MHHSVISCHDLNYMQEKNVPAFYAEGWQLPPPLKYKYTFIFLIINVKEFVIFVQGKERKSYWVQNSTALAYWRHISVALIDIWNVAKVSEFRWKVAHLRPDYNVCLEHNPCALIYGNIVSKYQLLIKGRIGGTHGKICSLHYQW